MKITPGCARAIGSLVLGCLFAGCGQKALAPGAAEAPKPTTIPVVPDAERSPSFLAVTRQLELGGPLYAYVDVDGDVAKFATGISALIGQVSAARPELAPYAGQDFAAIAHTLGLTDVKAIGLSSVSAGPDAYRNRVFFYTGGERHGLLAGLGGAPGAFRHLNLAPADTAFFGEADLDLAIVYRTIKDVVAGVAGEPAGNQLEAAIRKGGEAAALSLLDLIYGFKGHSAVILRVDPEKTMRLPAPPAGLTLPATSFLLCVEGIAPVIENALAKSPIIRRSDSASLHIYELTARLPLEGLQPVLVADGSTLYVASTRAFFDECRGDKAGLAQDPQFQQALARVGSEGNGVSYVSPQFFTQLRRIETLNPRLPAETRSAMSFILSQLPSTTQPLISVRTNLPDGILIRSHLNRSLKQDAMMFSIYNPVTIGLFAAMAIPAFQKVRTASQEKAVMNNLRQLAAAADQFYLENNVRTAAFNDLVGPSRLIPAINPVMGEDYRQVRFVLGEPVRIVLPDGRAIQYPPGAVTPAMQQRGTIQKRPPVKGK